MLHETLKYFLRTYFHQDWMEDYSSSFMALDDFIQHESQETVSSLYYELVDALSIDPFNEEVINEYGGNYSPSTEGLSVKGWLQEVCSKIYEVNSPQSRGRFVRNSPGAENIKGGVR